MRISSLSRDPQMARVEGFVSPAEAAHLIRIAAPELHPSRVARADVEIGGEGAAPAAGEQLGGCICGLAGMRQRRWRSRERQQLG